MIASELTMRTACGFVVLALLVIETGSIATAGSQEVDPTIVREIAAGDVAAIDRAGRSGRPAYIPYLKAKLSDKSLARSSWERVSPLSLALAQLGDANSGQVVWCWVTQKRTSFPLETLVDVGGYYSIRALDAVMAGAGNAAFEKAVKDSHPIDMGYDSPRHQALPLMQKVIPNGPVSGEHGVGSYFGADDDIQVWHAWIVAHSSELHERTPAGDGVDFFDAACRAGRPVKKRG
jgi:hypothetical protein